MHCLKKNQQAFLKLALEYKVLEFGNFILKSGQSSPYFFNVGRISTGLALSQLGEYLAHLIMLEKVEFEVLFGAAYKGIPIVSTTAIALAHNYNCNKSFCFNRKEKKGHGEGGEIVGASLTGKKVIIVDDVLTSGTAINQAVAIFKHYDAIPVAAVVAIDRQEPGAANNTVAEDIQKTLNFPIYSLINLELIVQYLSERPELADIAREVKAYQVEKRIRSGAK